MAKLQVLHQLNEEQMIQLYRLFQGEWWTKPRQYSDLKRLVQESDLIVALWDEEQQRLVAFARVLTDYLYRAFIFGVIVDHSVRGIGLGRRLMEEVMAKLEGIERIELYCQKHNIAFYEKIGFTRPETTALLRKV